MEDNFMRKIVSLPPQVSPKVRNLTNHTNPLKIKRKGAAPILTTPLIVDKQGWSDWDRVVLWAGLVWFVRRGLGSRG